MAWHSTWESSNISINEVKYLIADVVNAIQERSRLTSGASVSFYIVGGTSTSPTNASYVGMPVSEVSGTDLKTVLNQILLSVGGLAGEFFTDTTFATAWTYASLVTEVDILNQTDLENLENWRKVNWWLTIRGMLERMRYFELESPLRHVNYIIQTSDPALDGRRSDEGESPEDTWASLGYTSTEFDLDESGGLVGPVGYSVSVSRYLAGVAWPYKQWSDMEFSLTESCSIDYDINEGLTYTYDDESILNARVQIGIFSTFPVMYDGVSQPPWPTYEEEADALGDLPSLVVTIGEETITVPATEPNEVYSEDDYADINTEASGTVTISIDGSTIPKYPNHEIDIEEINQVRIVWNYARTVSVESFLFRLDLNNQYTYAAA